MNILERHPLTADLIAFADAAQRAAAVGEDLDAFGELANDTFNGIFMDLCKDPQALYVVTIQLASLAAVACRDHPEIAGKDLS